MLNGPLTAVPGIQFPPIHARVVLAPFHHIANHIVEAEGIRFLLPDLMGTGLGVIALFLDPS